MPDIGRRQCRLTHPVLCRPRHKRRELRPDLGRCQTAAILIFWTRDQDPAARIILKELGRLSSVPARNAGHRRRGAARANSSWSGSPIRSIRSFAGRSASTPAKTARSKSSSRSPAAGRPSSPEKRRAKRSISSARSARASTSPPDVRGKTAFLVGGGRGSRRSFSSAASSKTQGAEVKVLYGGKSLPRPSAPGEIRGAPALDIACSTDDGSFGFPGFVTGLLEAEIGNAAPDRLFVCGPGPDDGKDGAGSPRPAASRPRSRSSP